MYRRKTISSPVHQQYVASVNFSTGSHTTRGLNRSTVLPSHPNIQICGVIIKYPELQFATLRTRKKRILMSGSDFGTNKIICLLNYSVYVFCFLVPCRWHYAPPSPRYHPCPLKQQCRPHLPFYQASCLQ